MTKFAWIVTLSWITQTTASTVDSNSKGSRGQLSQVNPSLRLLPNRLAQIWTPISKLLEIDSRQSYPRRFKLRKMQGSQKRVKRKRKTTRSNQCSYRTTDYPSSMRAIMRSTLVWSNDRWLNIHTQGERGRAVRNAGRSTHSLGMNAPSAISSSRRRKLTFDVKCYSRGLHNTSM